MFLVNTRCRKQLTLLLKRFFVIIWGYGGRVNCSKIVRKLLVRYLALFDNVQGNRSLLACDLVNSKKITLH